MKQFNVPFMGFFLHIPHSSTVIPKAVRKTILLTDEELRAELLRMTDRYTDQLFQLPERNTARVVFPVSRLVVDPERFVDDSIEPMADVGMGAVYTQTSLGKLLRRPLSASEREQLLAKYYWTHHATLTQQVGRTLAHKQYCLIVDCHSFPSIALPHEPDKDLHRPDICIGTDSFHSPLALIQLTLKAFEQQKFSVATNRPYKGTLVPSEYYKKNKSVWSIMIEVNRKWYMNEET